MVENASRPVRLEVHGRTRRAVWSALAAVGAQYRLGGMVGLYFEPEGSYYFETDLKTARTDSPLTLTLRLGVALVLNKIANRTFIA